jgi:ferric-dicitrate binding protein FerR (iron transport regulator)
MSESIDWQLLARYLSGECSQEERNKIEAWIASDMENLKTVELMRVAWNVPEPQQQKSDVKKLWSEVAEQAGISAQSEDQKVPGTSEKAKIIRWPFDFQAGSYRILRYAAVLLAATSLVYFFGKGVGIFPWGQSSELQTLIVERGVRQSTTLSDGTIISLDAGSNLSYPKNFTGDTREVSLNGEGYFEVASNAAKPFIVHANHAVVRVLGTKFNVRAWQPDKKVTVAVSEGKVSLRSEEGAAGDVVVIVRGQASTLPESGRPSEPHPVDIDQYLGWMNNEVAFDDAPLQEILYQLERWYDVQFILSDSTLAEEHLTIHIQNKSIDDILELISVLTDLRYRHMGNIIQLRSGVIDEE